MRTWLTRTARVANTPVHWTALAPIIRDLVTPGRAWARWHAPLGALWAEATRQGPCDPNTLEAVIPEARARRSIRDEALARLRDGEAGASAFNAWRRDLGMRPLLLAGAELRELDLRSYDLSRCVLFGADLRGANLQGCKLTGAVLKNAKIAGAVLADDTLAGHDLEDLADALESESFQAWVRSVDRRSLSSLISVSEVSRKFKSGRRTLIWTVKLRNNIRQTLRTKVWLENGQHAEQVSQQTLGPYGSQVVTLKVTRDRYPPDRPLTLTLYVEGITPPVKRYQAWAWDRDWV